METPGLELVQSLRDRMQFIPGNGEDLEAKERVIPAATFSASLHAGRTTPTGMIVDGEDGVIKRQPEPASPPLPPPVETDPLLPAAGPSHHSERPPPNYQAALASPVVLPGPPQEYEPFLWIKQRESVDRRFFRALGIAIVIWAVLASAVEIIYTLATHANLSVPTKPSPSDGTVLQCYGRSSPTHGHWNSSGVKLPSDHSSLPKYKSVLHLEMPTDAALYLLSTGSLAYGSVMLLPWPSDDLSTIGIVVEVRYYSKDAFHHSDVCALERDDGSRGIGIYTPSYAWGKFPPDQQLEYRIEYRIPVRPPATTHVQSFETNVPHFLHILEDLGANVEFGQISLEGTNGNIGVQSLVAQTIVMKTSNAFISVVDALRANETVALFTSNAFIDAKVDLVNTDSLRPSRLAIVTNNGNVWLQTKLTWAPEADVRRRAAFDGFFDITAYTTNARADLAITHAPPLSKLSLTARTSNGPLTAMLYPTFEGDVLLHTTNRDRPAVHVSDTLGPIDPRYHGRRYVATQQGKRRDGEWRGHLAWEPSESVAPWWGRIDLTSSNARCTLAVPCVEANCLPVVRLGAG